MTKNREQLIEKFAKWLDTQPSRPFAEYQCANIAEDHYNILLKKIYNYLILYADFREHYPEFDDFIEKLENDKL